MTTSAKRTRPRHGKAGVDRAGPLEAESKPASASDGGGCRKIPKRFFQSRKNSAKQTMTKWSRLNGLPDNQRKIRNGPLSRKVGDRDSDGG